MPSFRLRRARSHASRKPRPPASARPTRRRFQPVGHNTIKPDRSSPAKPFEDQFNNRLTNMIDSKNRYGRTAARIHNADGLARRPKSTTIDIHAHIVIPQAAALAQPHVDMSRIPLAHFADNVTKDINAQQERDVRDVMTTIDRRLSQLDSMGIDIQVVAPAPNQCYYTVDPKIGEAAHRLANDGVAEYCARRADRFIGLGVVTLQEPEIALRELDYVLGTLELKGVQILTNVDGQELSD